MSSFNNPFKSKARVKSGKLAKDMGNAFESIFELTCRMSGVLATRIPDGCRMIRTRMGAVIPRRVATPFDYLITKQGLSACIDCKTVDTGNFSYSMLSEHQIKSLIAIYRSGVSAGYIVWFRKIDKVVYFRASQLNSLKPRESLKPEDGIQLGFSISFSLTPALELFEAVI